MAKCFYISIFACELKDIHESRCMNAVRFEFCAICFRINRSLATSISSSVFLLSHIKVFATDDIISEFLS